MKEVNRGLSSESEVKDRVISEKYSNNDNNNREVEG